MLHLLMSVKSPRNSNVPMDGSAFMRRARMQLQMTQAELAKALRLSVRAVQSYEQGWRKLPDSLAIQLLTFLGLDTDRIANSKPCWTVTGCKPEIRQNCPSFRIGNGHFCWMVAGDVCGGRLRPKAETTPHCLTCKVTADFFKG